jgi:predicted acylesterase/phospholipase RssA
MLDAASTPHIEHGREHTERAKKPTLEQRQVVLVFQGGGALGAYQAGVYQALHESGIEPDWIIGTSIGAINASLIAGNEPENRLDRLEEFWRRMRRKEFWGLSNWPGLSDTTSYWSTSDPIGFQMCTAKIKELRRADAMICRAVIEVLRLSK